MYVTLQSYVTYFTQQDKTQVAEIKTSVDNMNDKMENRMINFQDLDTCFDLMESGLEEVDFQGSVIAKFEHLALLVNIPHQELTSV